MYWTARTVAIVGPDGSGKTTQGRLLAERLRSTGYDTQYVHALYYLSDAVPYASQLRKQIGPRKTRTQTRPRYDPLYLGRRLLFGWFGYWFALITIAFVSVRFRNRIVVFDRYYQQFFYDIYGPAAGPLSCTLPQPWRTVYLVADLDTLRARLEPIDRAVDESYYARVIDVYEAYATDDWLRFHAERPVETLHGQIFEEIHRSIDAERVAPISLSSHLNGGELVDDV